VDQPLKVKKMLDAHGLLLAAIAFSTPSGLTEAKAYEDDIQGVKKMLDFLNYFPDPILGLAGANSPNKDEQYTKIDQACLFYNAVGRLAQKAGVRVNVHPHSHHGSLLETDAEYNYLIKQLIDEVALGPDSGHIIRGEQDLVQCVQKHARRIEHIHFKDVKDRQWTPIGHGICDFSGVIEVLRRSGYSGWIIAEEEATWTLEGRNHILPANRQYIEKLLSV